MKNRKRMKKHTNKKKASCEFQDEFTNAKNEAPTWSNMLSSWHTIQGTDQTVGLGSSWFHLRHICSTSAAHLQHTGASKRTFWVCCLVACHPNGWVFRPTLEVPSEVLDAVLFQNDRHVWQRACLTTYGHEMMISIGWLFYSLSSLDLSQRSLNFNAANGLNKAPTLQHRNQFCSRSEKGWLSQTRICNTIPSLFSRRDQLGVCELCFCIWLIVQLDCIDRQQSFPSQVHGKMKQQVRYKCRICS